MFENYTSDTTVTYVSTYHHHCTCLSLLITHYNDVIMSTMASQIASPHDCLLNIYSGADERKHQSSASLAFVRGIHRWPVNSPHKVPVTREVFPFDGVIMYIWNRQFKITFCEREIFLSGFLNYINVIIFFKITTSLVYKILSHLSSHVLCIVTILMLNIFQCCFL